MKEREIERDRVRLKEREREIDRDFCISLILVTHKNYDNHATKYFLNCLRLCKFMGKIER